MAATQVQIDAEPQAALDEDAAQELRRSLRGDVVRPGDANYDDVRRVWNGMIDKHPALIARCCGAADVMAAVNFARDRNLPLSVRGGGAATSASSRRLSSSPIRSDLKSGFSRRSIRLQKPGRS